MRVEKAGQSFQTGHKITVQIAISVAD